MRLHPDDVALCVADAEPDGPHDPLPTSPPIVQTSLFSFPTFEALLDGFEREFETNLYSRGRNPTVEAVERKIAALERAESCCCFASGMGAVSAVMLGLLRTGDHILFVNNIYGPTRHLASHLRRFGVDHTVVLELDADSIERRLHPATRLVWIESPGTMLFRTLDVGSVAALARSHGAVSCLDNSWATPLLQKPIEMGVDLVVHSATKYLAGHGDILAGAVAGSEELMREIFRRSTLLVGAGLSPFDAWLLLRGMRTLPARLRQHEEDGLAVARFLAGHPAVRRVYHPELIGPAGLVSRQLRGYSGLLSFELDKEDLASVAGVIDRLQHFRIGVSWGGVESVVISPAGRAPPERLRARGLPLGLIRLSVGLEGAELLIRDIERALEPLI